MKQTALSKKFYVYVLTNNINDKKYVGITSQKPEKRWNHGNGYRDTTYIGRAIKKYGWENFSHEILYENISAKEAQDYEVELIEKYKTLDSKFGYNIQPGGNLSNLGVKMSEENRQKLSERTKGENNYFYKNPPTKEHIEYLVSLSKERIGDKHPMYGKHHSEESKRKMSDAHKGINGSRIANSESVICLDNLKVYESISLAEKDTNAYLGGRLNEIHMSGINPNDDYFGLCWMKYNDYLKYSKDEIKQMVSECRDKNDHRIICINTKEVFESVKYACESINSIGQENNLRRACRSNTHFYHKDSNGNYLMWMFYKDYIKEFGEVS